jgi:hypothetical protein
MRAVVVRWFTTLAVVGLPASGLHAQEVVEKSAAPPTSGFRADVEVDPTAYALSGYSLHVGLGWRKLRVDLGAFAMSVPDAIHGQDGFKLGFDGYGVKAQWFPMHDQTGLFTGVDGGVGRALVKLEGSQLAASDTRVTFGIHAGYRIEIASGFYATPWIGVSYAVGAEDKVLGDKRFDSNPWMVFPAIHLGYHLRS